MKSLPQSRHRQSYTTHISPEKGHEECCLAGPSPANHANLLLVADVERHVLERQGRTRVVAQAHLSKEGMRHTVNITRNSAVGKTTTTSDGTTVDSTLTSAQSSMSVRKITLYAQAACLCVYRNHITAYAHYQQCCIDNSTYLDELDVPLPRPRCIMHTLVRIHLDLHHLHLCCIVALKVEKREKEAVNASSYS